MARDGRFELDIWVPGSGGDDDRERTLGFSNNIQEIIDLAYNTDLDYDEAFLLTDWKGIYNDLDQLYSAEDVEDGIKNIWHYDNVSDLGKVLGKALLPQNESLTEDAKPHIKALNDESKSLSLDEIGQRIGQPDIKELVDKANKLYDEESDDFSTEFAYDELAALWVMCQYPFSSAFDDEVYDAINNSRYGSKIFELSYLMWYWVWSDETLKLLYKADTNGNTDKDLEKVMQDRHITLDESLLTEAPGDKFTLDPKDMYQDIANTSGNSSPIQLGKVLGDKQRAKDEADRKERVRAEASSILDGLNAVETYEEKLEVLFDMLVPKKGMSGTVAGELVRATMRIIYRWFNDGDYFCFGYGSDTCGGSAAYIGEHIGSTIITSTYNQISKEVNMYGFDSDSVEKIYDDFTNKLPAEVVEYIINNPESLFVENKTDSRGVEPLDEILMSDCDVMLPYELQEIIDRGDMSESELVYEINDWWFDSGKFDDVYVEGDYLYFTDINEDMYNSIINHSVYKSLEEYGNRLWNEFGYDEEEEDEEEDEEFDESFGIKNSFLETIDTDCEECKKTHKHLYIDEDEDDE